MMIIYFASFLLTLFYVGLIAYYGYGWYRTRPFQPFTERANFSKTVSVLIPVRNEEASIQATIHDILKQEYLNDGMEVIVVDDFSSDRTRQYLEQIPDKRLRVFAMRDFFNENQLASPKKEALALAVSKAKGELIVTTDGDCRMGPHWLSTIVRFFEHYQPKLIAGPVVYQRSDSFLNAFQSLDLLSMMGITCASVANGLPVMCNGANLAFEKSAYDKVGGYSNNTYTATGDDVFLMLKVQNKYPGGVKFLKAREAVVTTEPQPTYWALFQQRKRWGVVFVSRSHYYRSFTRSVRSFFHVTCWGWGIIA
ncbi:MAG: glycosyl transferase [Bacteroidetes bacterium SW_11_45_7]|nr:MAG: glycosyl transferase [Bacteroidetes bacterium SW_11_45_7]